MRKQLPKIQDRLLSNGSYKVIAFIVALVLWATIQGRRDIVATREFKVEFLQNQKRTANKNVEKVVVKAQGPREALKRFQQVDEAISLDLRALTSGWHIIKLDEKLINRPLGVKVLSIEPETIKVQIIDVPQPKVEGTSGK